jgi:hypothetical protein
MPRPPKPENAGNPKPDKPFIPAIEGQPPSYSGTVDRRLWPKGRREAMGDGPTGLERRRGPGRRLSDFTKAAEEGHLTREQFLFLMAVEKFKKSNGKTFPTWTDVLEVVRLLGYRKTMPMELHLPAAEDWREAPDTPSNVRPDRWWQRQEIDEARRKGEAA